MSSEDSKLDPLEAPSYLPHEQPARRGRMGKWLATPGIAAVVVTLVAVLLIQAGSTAANRSTVSAGSTHWQTYQDPDSLYTLQLPPGWVAQVTYSAASYANAQGGGSATDEMINFAAPSQGTGSAHFYTVGFLITTDFDRVYYCAPNFVVPGFTPMSLEGMEHRGGVSMFTTKNAYFQIDVEIPGIVEPAKFGEPPFATPTPTPLPSTWLTTDSTDVNQMLASFQPTATQPLAC